MKPLLLSLLVVLSCSLPALAQKKKDPLKVEFSVFNGASDYNAGNPGSTHDARSDQAIRISIALTNQTGHKVQVTRIACSFFDDTGRLLAEDQVQPMVVGARAQQSAVLFYANNTNLFAFKATGVLEYEQNGQTFSVPINVDQSSQRSQTGY